MPQVVASHTSIESPAAVFQQSTIHRGLEAVNQVHLTIFVLSGLLGRESRGTAERRDHESAKGEDPKEGDW